LAGGKRQGPCRCRRGLEPCNRRRRLRGLRAAAPRLGRRCSRRGQEAGSPPTFSARVPGAHI
jgi:hypothetical protein